MAQFHTFTGEGVFAEQLAAFLLTNYDVSPVASAPPRILLPNKRSGFYLKQALLKASGRQVIALPEIFALGDLELTDWLSPDHPALQAAPPAVIAAEKRLAWVADQLLQANDPHISNVTAALLYAESFLALRDDCQRANLSCDKLNGLVSLDYAEHWATALALFHQMMGRLDAMLAKEKLIEPMQFLQWKTDAIVQEWKAHPPAFPLIAAGSTASTPTTRQLYQVLATLDNATIILPKLDRLMLEEDWAQLSVTHPQAPLKHLLEALRLQRDAITVSAPHSEREKLVSTAMLPESGALRMVSYMPSAEAVKGLSLCEYDTEYEEALGVMLHIKQALHEGKQSIVVVSDDDGFVSQLTAHLARYDIPVNRSGGMEARSHPAFRFLMLLAELMCAPYRSATLLALLRHPYCLPEHRAEALTLAAQLEKRVRGVHGMTTLQGVWQKIAYKLQETPLYAPLHSLTQASLHMATSTSMAAMAKRLNVLVEQFHPSAGKNAEEDIAQLYHKLENLTSYMHGTMPARPSDMLHLLRHYLGQKRLQLATNRDAAVQILGVLEARLITADLLIVSHLNRGIYPKTPKPDAWLSLTMRRSLGIDVAERQMGLSAHDVMMLLHAPCVILTRAKRERNTPTEVSPYFERMRLVMPAQQHDCHYQLVRYYQQQNHQAIEVAQMNRPAPMPPLEVRPKEWAATTIDTLMKNPFAVYVSHILRLREWERLDAPFDNKTFGKIIHEILQDAAPLYHANSIEDYLQALADGIQEKLAPYIPETERHFHQKRLEQVINGLCAIERRRIHEVALLEAEKTVTGPLDETLGLYIKARIDRLEHLPDGSVRIIDYKSGKPPSQKDVEQGKALQLLIAGLLCLQESVLPTTNIAIVKKLEYWHISGRTEEAEKILCPIPVDNIVWAYVQERLMTLLQHYSANAHASFDWQGETYLRTVTEHIARIGEW